MPDDTTNPDALVRLDIDRGVATITLDSPDNRNALSRALVADLRQALGGADAGIAAGSVRSIVLTHTPPVFCAGADLKERASKLPSDNERASELPSDTERASKLPSDNERASELPSDTERASEPTASTERASEPRGSEAIVEVLATLMDIEVPTIAAVSGPVRAGGIGLMAACDLVVVHRDVVFALTEVRIGVAAAIISVPILRRASPSHLAAAFLTGEPFSAESARQAGLVTHVTDDVSAVVGALCEGVANGAPGAVAATKRLLRGAYDASASERSQSFEQMRLLSNALFGSAEAAEGMAAFAEKRPPSWQRRA